MVEAGVQGFTGHQEFEAHLRTVLENSVASLEMFDPDFSVFPLGAADVDAALRHFLRRGGHLRLAMHSSGHIERYYPRFLTLLRDYSHRIECRVTGRNLHQLTDSFCIGDEVHIVRRFHSDHMRGEAAFHTPQAAEISAERFRGIWAESLPGLHATTTGL
ncbi:DUF7931 domain-containing protein [Massilia cavernae]|uniref:DUF7931 domain-containing protein n=1 Tax=Massilia cavernae TaxID=2320864 RepID=A0A418XGF2_9BURK|nr:hypothetical protein [Massilia cavernae]RJG11542.1 hypothetical protein D3872_19225 [Massilia cavernae]